MKPIQKDEQALNAMVAAMQLLTTAVEYMTTVRPRTESSEASGIVNIAFSASRLRPEGVVLVLMVFLL